MKKLLALILAGLPAVLSAAPPSPYPTTVDVRRAQSPVLETYQANKRTFRVTFQDGGSAMNLTNTTNTMAWFTSAFSSSMVTGTAALVSGGSNGVCDFTFTPAQLNTNGNFFYELVVRDTNGALVTVKQGPFRIRPSPVATGVQAVDFEDTINWSLFSYTGTASEGPYRAGTGITFGSANADGSIPIQSTLGATITGNEIVDGTISNADLAASAVTSNKINWATMPSGLQDGDDDTTYSAGTGISISGGNAISATLGTAVASNEIDWASMPAGLQDGDQDTSVAVLAGTGITVTTGGLNRTVAATLGTSITDAELSTTNLMHLSGAETATGQKKFSAGIKLSPYDEDTRIYWDSGTLRVDSTTNITLYADSGNIDLSGSTVIVSSVWGMRPSLSNAQDLGSADYPWRTGYFATATIMLGDEPVTKALVQGWNTATGQAGTAVQPGDNWTSTVAGVAASTLTNQAAQGATAYGWGDHGTQGYLSAEADTLQSVLTRGSQATITNDLDITNGTMVLHMQPDRIEFGDGVTIIALETNGEVVVGNLEYLPSTYHWQNNTAQDWLDWSGAAIFGGAVTGLTFHGDGNALTNLAELDPAFVAWTNGETIAAGSNSLADTWGVAVGTTANGTNLGVAVGYQATGNDGGTALGAGANGYYGGLALGYGTTGYGTGNVAAGYYATATGTNTAQIGTGTNSNSGTLQFRDWTVMDANGVHTGDGSGLTGVVAASATETQTLAHVIAQGTANAGGATNLNASELRSGTVPNARLDADLQTWAGVSPSANGQTLVAGSYATMRTNLSLVVGSNVQAYDADLTTYAGITPSANIQTLLGSATYAAARTNLSLVVGSNVQAYDADLATLAAPGNWKTIYYNGSGAATALALGVSNTVMLSQGAAVAPVMAHMPLSWASSSNDTPWTVNQGSTVTLFGPTTNFVTTGRYVFNLVVPVVQTSTDAGSGTLTFQSSSDGTSWTDVFTFGYYFAESTANHNIAVTVSASPTVVTRTYRWRWNSVAKNITFGDGGTYGILETVLGPFTKGPGTLAGPH